MKSIQKKDQIIKICEKLQQNIIQITENKYELGEEPKKQVNRVFIDEKLAVKVIMDCRRTMAHKFRTRLVFKQYDVVLTKEQSVLTKIMSQFEGENMQTQYNVLSYGIDLYFHDYKLAIEIDENEHTGCPYSFFLKSQPFFNNLHNFSSHQRHEQTYFFSPNLKTSYIFQSRNKNIS